MLQYWFEIIIAAAILGFIVSKKLPVVKDWATDAYVAFRDWRVRSEASDWRASRLIPVETGLSAYPRARVIAFTSSLSNLIPDLYLVGPAIYDAHNTVDILDSHFIVAFRRKKMAGSDSEAHSDGTVSGDNQLTFPIATTIVLRNEVPYWKLHGDPGSISDRPHPKLNIDPSIDITVYRYVPIQHGDISLAALAKAAGLVQ